MVGDKTEHVSTKHMKTCCRMTIIIDVGTNIEGITTKDIKNNLIGELCLLENKLNKGNARHHFKDPKIIYSRKKANKIVLETALEVVEKRLKEYDEDEN